MTAGKGSHYSEYADDSGEDAPRRHPKENDW
jgi:hypothetical protein